MAHSIQIPLIGESVSQIPLDIEIPAKKRGNPSFKPKWGSPTKAIRIPEKYCDLALSIFQKCDQDKIEPSSIDLTNLWNQSQTTYKADPITGYELAEVYRIPLGRLKTDPKRFQYKLIQYDQNGSTNSLLGVSAWDENLAGTLLIWRDPIDGLNYVINGHNRYSKALSLGVPSLKCEFIKAKNAIEARAIGALRNIAEGNGTAIDAAKFFRDSSLSESDIKRAGYLPLTRSTVKDGIALANLSDPLFSRLTEGRLSIKDGAIIGGNLGSDLQGETLTALDKGITGNELLELCTLINASESEQIEQFSLFGTDTFTVTNAIERAKKITWLKNKLSKDRRIFGTVARNDQALAKGNNQIDAVTSKGIADQSSKALALFDQLKLQAGPLASLINNAANGAISDDQYYSQALTLLADPYAC
jgi:hypothetical protein